MDGPTLPPILPAYAQRMRTPSLPGVKQLLGSSAALHTQAYRPAHQLQISANVTSVGISLEKYLLSDRVRREGNRTAEKKPVSSSITYDPGPVLSSIAPLSPLPHHRDLHASAREPSRWSSNEASARGWRTYDSTYQEQAPSPTDVDHYPSSSSSSSSGSSSGSLRLLGVRIIPGCGDCFVYNDGSFIPTQVDGHSVNPDWGLTKQQKARKRLPKACTRCHKKKQRCEPLEGGCAQCRKVNKPCDL